MIGMMTFMLCSLGNYKDNSIVVHLMYYPVLGFCFVLICHLAIVEQMQMKESGFLNHFLNIYNWIDSAHLIMNIIFIAFTLFDFEFMDANKQRTWAAISICFLWLKLFDWMRLFDGTAFFMRLLGDTIWDIKYFLVIMFIVYEGFGSAFHIIDMSRQANEEGSIMTYLARMWFVNSFQYTYLLGLGEFDLENATNGSNIILFYGLFNISTFLIMIVLLNMLIAVMSDTYDKVREDTEKFKRKTALDLMSEYIKLIDCESLSRKNMTLWQKFDDFFEFLVSSSQASPCSNKIDSDQSSKVSNILVVVEPDNEFVQADTWDGNVNTIIRETKAMIKESVDSLT